MNANTIIESVNKIPNSVAIFFKEYLGKISAHALGWLAIVLCHFASIPTLVAVLMSQSDKMPPVDLMLFVWSALIAMFFKALIDRNTLYTATICLGFAVQTLIMGLILFK